MFGLFKKPKIDDVAPRLTFEEQKRRVKIVVVDDDPNSFPTELLKEDGYTIDSWPRLDAARLQRLEASAYDIIILDIQGITDASLSDTGDGLGVLKRIKNVNPNQVVVAFSGNQYDLSKVPFWRLADETLQKPVSYITCKELLDDLIKKQVSAGAYWASIERLLKQEGVPEAKIRKLEKEILSKSKGNGSISGEEIRKLVGGVLKSAATIVSLIDKLLALWKHSGL